MYYLFLKSELKKFYNDLNLQNSPSLLVCRLCENKVSLAKFVIHTELCMKTIEHKKRFQELDDLLLDFGEEITTLILTLSKQLYFFKL